MSYVGRQVGSPRAVLLAGGMYTGGRMLAYLVLGAAAVWSADVGGGGLGFLQGTVHRLLGPLLIVVGLLLLGRVPPESPRRGCQRGATAQSRPLGVLGRGAARDPVSPSPSARCPRRLFFGSLVPLAADHGSPLLLPSVYGVGTALPVAGFAVLLAIGAGWLGRALDRVQQLERWARRVTAVVFIGLGVYETLRSTLYLI